MTRYSCLLTVVILGLTACSQSSSSDDDRDDDSSIDENRWPFGPFGNTDTTTGAGTGAGTGTGTGNNTGSGTGSSTGTGTGGGTGSGTGTGDTGTGTGTGTPSDTAAPFACPPAKYVPDLILHTPPEVDDSVYEGRMTSVCATPNDTIIGIDQRWWERDDGGVWCLVTFEWESSEIIDPHPIAPQAGSDPVWAFSYVKGVPYEDGTSLCKGEFYDPLDLVDSRDYCLAMWNTQLWPPYDSFLPPSLAYANLDCLDPLKWHFSPYGPIIETDGTDWAVEEDWSI